MLSWRSKILSHAVSVGGSEQRQREKEKETEREGVSEAETRQKMAWERKCLRETLPTSR